MLYHQLTVISTRLIPRNYTIQLHKIFTVPQIEIGLHTQPAVSTAELHLSGLIGTAGQPDMQTIRIIGFFLKIGYIGSVTL